MIKINQQSKTNKKENQTIQKKTRKEVKLETKKSKNMT